MDSRLPVEKRFCVKWSTEIRREPGYSTASAYFSFRNEQYFFKLHLNAAEKFELVLNRSDSIKNKQRSKKKVARSFKPLSLSVERSFRPLSITVLLEYYLDERETVAYYATLSTFYNIFTVPGVICEFREWYGCSNVAHFVCFLQDTDGDESLQIQNDQETRNLSTAIDSTSDLEELSRDLGNLFKNETLPDVKLKYGKGRIISAHKTVLAARSKVFAAMFGSKMTESQTGEVDLGDMEQDIVDAFLQYVYMGIFPSDLSNGIVPELYSIADKYDVGSLLERCREQMLNSLSEENCVDCLVLADRHSDLAFKHSVINFFCTNEAILKSKTWLKFSRSLSPLAIEVYENYVNQKSLKDAK